MNIARKLKALDYPNPTAFKINDSDITSLVAWLDEFIIHALSEKERRELKNKPNSREKFISYLSKVGLPADSDINIDLDRLLGFAVHLEHTTQLSRRRRNSDIKMDFNGSQFGEKLDSISQIMKIVDGAGRLDVFKAVRMAIQNCVTRLDSFHTVTSGDTKSPNELDVEEMISKSPYCSVGDTCVARCLLVLRLLNLRELRKLQTMIDSLIVKIQKLTADPKTNSKLGVVGY